MRRKTLLLLSTLFLSTLLIAAMATIVTASTPQNADIEIVNIEQRLVWDGNALSEAYIDVTLKNHNDEYDYFMKNMALELMSLHSSYTESFVKPTFILNISETRTVTFTLDETIVPLGEILEASVTVDCEYIIYTGGVPFGGGSTFSRDDSYQFTIPGEDPTIIGNADAEITSDVEIQPMALGTALVPMTFSIRDNNTLYDVNTIVITAWASGSGFEEASLDNARGHYTLRLVEDNGFETAGATWTDSENFEDAFAITVDPDNDDAADGEFTVVLALEFDDVHRGEWSVRLSVFEDDNNDQQSPEGEENATLGAVVTFDLPEQPAPDDDGDDDAFPIVLVVLLVVVSAAFVTVYMRSRAQAARGRSAKGITGVGRKPDRARKAARRPAKRKATGSRKSARKSTPGRRK